MNEGPEQECKACLSGDPNELVGNPEIAVVTRPCALDVVRSGKTGVNVRSNIHVIVAMLPVATMTFLPPATFAQQMLPENEHLLVQGTAPRQNEGLAREIAQLRSRIVRIQAAFAQVHQDEYLQVPAPPVGAANRFEAGTRGAANMAPMTSNDTGIAGSASTAMPSDLPGFPGASHIYQVGATGFFLDFAAAIKLTANQQALLNEIKAKSIGDLAAAQNRIDQAEQKLWMITSSDHPDALVLEATVREIGRLIGDRRIAFIRSVGDAAHVLSEEQRAALLGISAPKAEQEAAQRGTGGSVNSRGMGPTDADGTGVVDSPGNTGGNTPEPKSNTDGQGDK